jgi:cytochrome b pre-mRNA-processing protein 3
MMNFLRRLFDRSFGRDDWRALYSSCVREARNPDWYRQGDIEDSVSGRFEMLSLIISLLFIRLEQEGASGESAQLMLTELLVEDVDAQFREDGMGDAGLGKHMGTMMSSFGGRLDAYRLALQDGNILTALERNLYRGVTPSKSAMTFSVGRMVDLHAGLANLSIDRLRRGAWPK